jgi:hypothetical protein
VTSYFVSAGRSHLVCLSFRTTLDTTLHKLLQVTQDKDSNTETTLSLLSRVCRRQRARVVYGIAGIAFAL